MEIELSTGGGTARLALAGEIGLGDARELKERLQNASAQCSAIEVDMSLLSAMHASALQVMHSWQCAGRSESSIRRVSQLPHSIAETVAYLGGAGNGCGRVCGRTSCIFE